MDILQPGAPGLFLTPARLDRAQGCLLGQLIGDSLGSLVEFSSADYLSWKHPQGVRELQDGGVWTLLAGQPTDDSELALMLARTLVREKKFDQQAVFASYGHWYRSGPFDIGNTTRRALAGSGPDASSQANGSLMRISPLAIFAARDPEQAAAWAREDSQLTHPHPVCQDACAVFVAATATAINSVCTAADAYRVARTLATRPGVAPEVTEAVEKARYEPPEVYDDDRQGWVLIALQNALYQSLHADNLEEGLVDTIQHGGDTDTNGAIAGALLGAIHGRAGVPERWVQVILACRPAGPPIQGRHHHPRPEEFWPCDALELAEALLQAGAREPG